MNNGPDSGDAVFRPEREMMRLFEELSFPNKVGRILRGLKQPKGSGEYKWARLEMIRLSAPVSAVAVPCIVVLLLMIFSCITPDPVRTITITYREPDPIPERLDPVKRLPDPQRDIDRRIDDITFEPAADPRAVPGPQAVEPIRAITALPAKSPVIMRRIMPGRSTQGRRGALVSGNAPPGTECAIMRALRWLKKNQNEDGSWPNHKAAMTGLALLTFLAHDETPEKEEFGYTVENAIRWLMDNRDKDGGYPRKYEHAIAAYALCEAYLLTDLPQIGEAAEQAIDIIIQGQNPQGGWRYAFNGSEKSDTSCIGWCAQALKAAKIASLTNPGLDECIEKTVTALKRNAHAEGGFGYIGPGQTGLTGTGVLCLQLLGAAEDKETLAGLALLEKATFNWDGGGFFNKNYYWYYITQAKFNFGGEQWSKWNDVFATTLVARQSVIPKAITDPEGRMQDIGYWDMDKNLSGHTDGPVMNTALCALQLQVYYRYLGTYCKDGESRKKRKAGFESERDIKPRIVDGV